MSKELAIVGSAVFLVIGPGFVAGLVPWWISRWRVEAFFSWRRCFSVLLGACCSRWGSLASSILLSDSHCKAWVRRPLSSQPR